jgi:hypothetical protein
MISTYVKCHHPRKFDVCTIVHITFIKLNNLVDFSGRWVLHNSTRLLFWSIVPQQGSVVTNKET